jgi:alanine racemase
VGKECDKLNIKNYKLHSTNSAALFRHKNFNEDMCRVGISVYGYTGNTFPLNVPDLKPVLSLWAERLSARKLKKDQKVGYGGLFTAPRDMEVSTYDIGYGDGFKRINPKTEFKTTCGKKILGQVSMDSFSCESTEDAVCLFDNVHELAKIHKTISYEILTSLDPILRKVII